MGKNSNVATPPVHGQLSFLRWLVLLPNYTVGPGSGANGKNAENADRVAVNRCHWTMSWSNEDESSLSSARFSLDPPFFPLFFFFFFPLRVFLARWIFINLLVQAVGSESASGAASFDVPRRAFLHRVPFTPFLAAYSAQGESSKCRSHRDPIENFDDRWIDRWMKEFSNGRRTLDLISSPKRNLVGNSLSWIFFFFFWNF